LPDNIYWRPKKKPKEVNRRTTAIGLKREAIVEDWQRHMLDEHRWGTREADPILPVLLCGGCAEFTERLHKTEEVNG